MIPRAYTNSIYIFSPTAFPSSQPYSHLDRRGCGHGDRRGITEFDTPRQNNDLPHPTRFLGGVAFNELWPFK
jgi:hypothetical protein